jgi:archaellum component FlaC
MSTLTDNYLRELKDLINSKFEQVDRKIEQVDRKIEQGNEKIDSKFEKVFEEFTTVKVEIATIKSDVNGLGNRLSNLEFTNRGILISVVSGLLIATITLIVKFLVPPIG